MSASGIRSTLVPDGKYSANRCHRPFDPQPLGLQVARNPREHHPVAILFALANESMPSLRDTLEELGQVI